MLHTALRPLVKQAAQIRTFSYDAMYTYLETFYDQSDIDHYDDFQSLLLEKTVRRRAVDHAKLIAYYLYFQDQTIAKKTTPNIKKLLKQTKRALKLDDDGSNLVVVNHYIHYKRFEKLLKKFDLGISATTNLITSGYFGIVDTIGIANNSQSVATMGLQLMQSHLFIHCLVSIPGGMTTVIKNIAALISSYYEIQALRVKLNNPDIDATLRKEYKQQIVIVGIQMATSLITMTLSLIAILEPFITSNPILSIPGPYVMLLSLGIQLFRHLAEGGYYLNKWLRYRKMADNCADPNEESMLNQKAQKYYQLMQAAFTNTVMTAITIGLTVGAMAAPNPIMVLVFAPLLIIGVVMLLHYGKRKLNQHSLSKEVDHSPDSTAANDTPPTTASHHLETPLQHRYSVVDTTEQFGLFHHDYDLNQRKIPDDEDEDGEGDGAHSSDSISAS